MESDILEQYFIIASLLMPAIIMITIRRWITPINCNFFQNVYKFVGYGIFNFAVFSLAAKILNFSYKKVFVLGGINCFQYLIFTFILPILLGCFLAFIDKKQIVEKIALILGLRIETNPLSSWEEIFSQDISDNITIILRNSKIIKGKFATPSRASSSIENKDLYLTKIHSIDGNCDNLPASMWINGNNIAYIEFEKFKLTSNESIIFKILKSRKDKILNLMVKIYSGMSEINKKSYEIRNDIKEILNSINEILVVLKEKEVSNDIREIKEAQDDNK